MKEQRNQKSISILGINPTCVYRPSRFMSPVGILIHHTLVESEPVCVCRSLWGNLLFPSLVSLFCDACSKFGSVLGPHWVPGQLWLTVLEGSAHYCRSQFPLTTARTGCSFSTAAATSPQLRNRESLACNSLYLLSAGGPWKEELVCWTDANLTLR